MPLFTTREPRLEEAPKLANLGRQTFVETFAHLYRPEDLETFLAEKYDPLAIARELTDPDLRYQVVEHEGKLVGFIKIGPLSLPVTHPPSRSGEIKQLYLLQDHLSRGLGRRLMAWAFEQFSANHTTEIFLSVFSENERAIRFYQSFGFTKCGEYHYPVGEQLDLEWIMVLSEPDF